MLNSWRAIALQNSGSLGWVYLGSLMRKQNLTTSLSDFPDDVFRSVPASFGSLPEHMYHVRIQLFACHIINVWLGVWGFPGKGVFTLSCRADLFSTKHVPGQGSGLFGNEAPLQAEVSQVVPSCVFLVPTVVWPKQIDNSSGCYKHSDAFGDPFIKWNRPFYSFSVTAC